MTTTITTPASPPPSITPSTYTPFVVLPFATEQDSGNQAHPLVGGGVDITFQPPTPRTGTLHLGFRTIFDADNCRRAHALPGPFRLEDTDVFTLNMNYVPVGTITMEADDVLGWWVVINFQELP